MTKKNMLLLDFKLDNILIDKEDNVLYFTDNSYLIKIDSLIENQYIPHMTPMFASPPYTYWNKYISYYYNRILGAIINYTLCKSYPESVTDHKKFFTPYEMPKNANAQLRELLGMCFDYNTDTFEPKCTWLQICNYIFRIFGNHIDLSLLPSDES